MSRLVFDAETDGYLRHTKNLWCIATQDIDTEEKILYPPYALTEGIVALRAAECLIGHNILGFDLPALWKLTGEWDHVPLVVDTVLVSRALYPERMPGHSLEAWGKTLGFPKGDFTDFKGGYTEEMGVYCERDVELNVQVYHVLNKELQEQYGEQLTGYKAY